MAAREPKTRSSTNIEIIGRDALKKGTLQLTSGNIIFSRKHGEETLKLTYQQLIEILEKEVAYQSIDIKKRNPKGRADGNDFSLNIGVDEEESLYSESYECPLARMQSRRMNEGFYDIDHGLAKGRQKKHMSWYASISVQAVITILDYYIDRELVKANDRTALSEDVVITRPQMRGVLLRLLKKLGY